MGESTKALLAILMIAGAIAGMLAWYDDRPNTAVWSFRIASPVVAFICLALLLKLQFRKDLAPDYLRQTTGTYFNRAGFCFLPTLTVIDRRCWAVLWFQNQHDRPCVGEVAIIPAQGFFLARPDIPTITFRIECGPAEFGVARVPINFPEMMQGEPQKFEVGAVSRFPEGRGKLLRFFDGISVNKNSRFSTPLRNATMLLGAAGGMLVLMRPASCTLQLPDGELESDVAGLEPVIQTLWTLGDPPLGSADDGRVAQVPREAT